MKVTFAAAYQPPVLSVVAPLPGGDIDVVIGRGRRKASARRTFRPQRLPVDWQFAVPIAPAGDEVIVTASVWAKLPSYPGGGVTSELCAQRIQASRPPEPLDPPLELQPDKVFTTDRQIFNFVLPPSLAVGT